MDQPQQQTPKYYKSNRKAVGDMLSISKVLGGVAKSTTVGGVSIFAGTWLADSKIALLLPIILGTVGYLSSQIKDYLDFRISITEIDDTL